MTRLKDAVVVSGAADIIDVLAEVPRATLRRISEDTGRDIAGLYRNLNLLIARRLIEPAGFVPVDRGHKAMSYRLHPRLREQP